MAAAGSPEIHQLFFHPHDGLVDFRPFVGIFREGVDEEPFPFFVFGDVVTHFSDILEHPDFGSCPFLVGQGYPIGVPRFFQSLVNYDVFPFFSGIRYLLFGNFGEVANLPIFDFFQGRDYPCL